ncbi:unnamed protein product [Trichobilharzia szidati]|nr:unnamed protein product [Trichobilharzia szidati]
MTTKINQATEESNEIFYSKNPTSSCSSSAPSAACNEYKENGVPMVRLQVPVQRTYRECMHYALAEWRCACLTIIILTGISIISSCGIQRIITFIHSSNSYPKYHHSYHNNNNAENTLYFCQTSSLLIISGLIFLIYLIYLIESWQSRNWIRTTWLVDTNMAYNLVQYAHKLIPSIFWQIKCYHYAHNTTEQHRKFQSNQKQKDQQCVISNEINSNNSDKHSFVQGNYDNTLNNLNKQTDQSTIELRKTDETFSPYCESNIHQIKCQRIISMNKMCSFDISKIDSVWDMSDYISKLENFKLIELNLTTLFSFSDKQTFLEFQRQKQDFFTTYEKFDIYMETEQICTFSDTVKFPEQMLIMHKSSKPPIYLKGITYLIATLLLCSFPLRIFIYAHKAKLHCKIHKVFGPKPLDENLNNSLKFIPLTNTNKYTSPYLPATFSGHRVPSVSDYMTAWNYRKTRQFIGHTTQSQTSSANNFNLNNEAVVLFNKYTPQNSSRYSRDGNKTHNKFHPTVSSELEYNQRSNCNKMRNVNGIDGANDDDIDEDFDEDDDELLSLDIRFEEYIRNKCANTDNNNAGSDCYDYEFDSVLKNSNCELKTV